MSNFHKLNVPDQNLGSLLINMDQILMVVPVKDAIGCKGLVTVSNQTILVKADAILDKALGQAPSLLA